jgi:hypothetical protein
MAHEPGNSFPRLAAKLSLWLPFVGLVVSLSSGAILQHPEYEKVTFWRLLLICLPAGIIWLLGIILGVAALCGTKTCGRKGILGRALFGLPANGLFLAAMSCFLWYGLHFVADHNRRLIRQAEEEFQWAQTHLREGETVDGKLLAIADRAMGEQESAFIKGYTRSFAALTNPPASVKSLEDLRARKEDVAEFVQASRALEKFLKTVVVRYKNELERHKISDSARRIHLQTYIQTKSDANAKALAIARAQIRKGGLLTKQVTLLEKSWGEWTYLPGTHQLQFQDPKNAAIYEQWRQEIHTLDGQMVALANELKELKRPRPPDK